MERHIRFDLYARNITGGIKHWCIMTTSNYEATIVYGILSEHTKYVFAEVSAKDIDKEIASRVSKKRKEGFRSLTDLGIDPSLPELEDMSIRINILNRALPKYNLDDNFNLKPMKAQPFKEGSVKYPAFAQPKLNGLRAVIRWESIILKEGLFEEKIERAVIRSKEGLEYHMPHITDSLVASDFIDNGIKLAFDGELYNHGARLNQIKASCPMYNSKGTLSKPSNDPRLIQFHSFDLSIPDVIQHTRLDMLRYVAPQSKNFIVVPSRIITSDAEAIEYRNECITAGYEGIVIRDLNQEYAFGFRPGFIRKFKTHMDSEFLILGIYPQDNDTTRAMFRLQNDVNSETFECTPVGTDEEHSEYLKHPEEYIGKLATVRYRERSGVKNCPFHANVIAIRNTEEDS